MHKRTLTASLTAFALGAAGLTLISHAQNDDATEPASSEQQRAQSEGQGAEQLAIEPEAGETDTDDISYALGFRIGSDFAQQGVELNTDEFAAGLTAALGGEEARLSDQELMQALFTFQLQMQARQQEQANRVAQESREFLEQNREAEGVQVTDSGLQYKVIEEGEGESPKASDTVTVHYRGTLVNGQQFDSSYDRGEPAQFQANRVIAGWTEALQMMKPGAKWELYIPAELGYGAQGAGQTIPPNAALIFEVELLGVESAE